MVQRLLFTMCSVLLVACITIHANAGDWLFSFIAIPFGIVMNEALKDDV